MISIEEWLRKLDLERYAGIFLENEVDFATLEVLTDNDLKELGLPFGPRKRLLSAIVDLNRPQQPAIEPSAGISIGERRQLTVLFCDMVGFTELAHRVDPEVLQNIVRAYEDACAVCRSEEHTSELQSLRHLVCRLLLEKKKYTQVGTLRGAPLSDERPRTLSHAHI